MSRELRTPLHEACHEGNWAIVKLLLDSGEDKFGKSFVRKMMSTADDDGATPLHLGTEFPHVD